MATDKQIIDKSIRVFKSANTLSQSRVATNYINLAEKALIANIAKLELSNTIELLRLKRCSKLRVRIIRNDYERALILKTKSKYLTKLLIINN